MLTSLSIRNIILVKSVDIDVTDGLCVLTGETGAGKSILLDALGFVLGNRANAKLIRDGEEKASVTAYFKINNHHAICALLKEADLDANLSEGLMLRRTIDIQGKSKAFVNDQQISVSLLKSIGDYLVEVHGQHAQKGLLDSKTNRSILDQYANHRSLLENIKSAYQNYHRLKQEREELIQLQQKAAEEEEYLNYVLKELDQYDLTVDEEQLAQTRSRLMNQEKIAAALQDGYALLNEDISVLRQLQKAQQCLEKLVTLDTRLTAIVESLERAAIEIEEADQNLQQLLHGETDSQEQLEQVESQLFALRGMARKYHVQVSELEQYKQTIIKKLHTITHKEQALDEITKALHQAKKNYIEVANQLTEKRQKAAKNLEKQIHHELNDLKMSSTRFKIDISALEEEKWQQHGIDKITFMASTNAGSTMGSIASIASGGELSRFMLALKVCLTGVTSIPTLIFDEVDTGIGGATAEAVGKRLKTLGNHVQVLVVTHQPQVASKGELHLKIEKTTSNSTTTTSVRVLSPLERKQEIARMLSGEHITEEALAAAEKLFA